MGMFEVPADAYIRFMGTFSAPLAVRFAAFGLADVEPSSRVLDVGCGPGMLTAELLKHRAPTLIAAVDPVPTFLAANANAHPGVDIRQATADDLPFDDETFGATLAQLVVNFMPNPLAGITEMARATRSGGRISACVWDHGGGTGALSPYWRAARKADPSVDGERSATGSNSGDLGDLLTRAGLNAVSEVAISVAVPFPDFDTWWEPFTLGVGPPGAHFAGLSAEQQREVASLLQDEYGEGPFTIHARAWAASGTK